MKSPGKRADKYEYEICTLALADLDSCLCLVPAHCQVQDCWDNKTSVPFDTEAALHFLEENKLTKLGRCDSYRNIK